MWYDKYATLYYPVANQEKAQKLADDGIRLAEANPGVFDGEDRCIWLFFRLSTAQERHPYHTILECRLSPSVMDTAQTEQDRYRKTVQGDWEQITDRIAVHCDIPADCIVTSHNPMTSAENIRAGSDSAPSMLSEAHIKLMGDSYDALMHTHKMLKHVSEFAINGVYDMTDASGQKANAWQNFYKSMPGLNNWTEECFANTRQADTTFVSAQTQTISEWCHVLGVISDEVKDLDLGHNTRLIADVNQDILAARDALASILRDKTAGTPRSVYAWDKANESLLDAVTSLADHLEATAVCFEESNAIPRRRGSLPADYILQVVESITGRGRTASAPLQDAAAVLKLGGPHRVQKLF